jgi:hypothetical protein
MEQLLDHSLALLDSEPGEFAFYSWKNVMITCWSRRATGPAVERVTLAREAMEREHPEGVSVVYLIADNAGLPTPEARAGAKQLMARFRHKRACLALVVQGAGFWASAMRGAITGARLLIPDAFPMRICGDVAEVVDWLPLQHAERTGTKVEPETLRTVLQDLMATL